MNSNFLLPPKKCLKWTSSWIWAQYHPTSPPQQLWGRWKVSRSRPIGESQNLWDCQAGYEFASLSPSRLPLFPGAWAGTSAKWTENLEVATRSQSSSSPCHWKWEMEFLTFRRELGIWKSLPSLSLLLFSHAQTSSNCVVGSWWWSVMGAHRKQNSQEGKTFLLHWSCGSERVESTSIAFFPFCPPLPWSWMKMQLQKCTAE